jgi:hypothetical protein
MGLLKGAIKTVVAAKVLQIAQREMSKPENQQKAKELIGKLASRTKGGSRG